VNPDILTYADAVQYLRLFLGRNATSAAEDDIYHAIHAAYRELTAVADWAYLAKQGRIHLKAAITDATVRYLHSGGPYENQLTFSTDITLDADYRWWRVRVGDVVSHIADVKSGQIVTLDPVLNFGADIAAGTACTLERRVYPLPNDFGSFNLTLAEGGTWGLGEYIPPEEWLALERNRSDTGVIQYHTVFGMPDAYGTMALGVWPTPSAAATLDFIYDAKPRQLRYPGTTEECRAGTATITAGAPKVTGTGGNWTDDMVGSIIRFGDTTNYPTGRDGRYPFSAERAIVSRINATWMYVDRAITDAHTAVKYVITDPVDLHSSMFNAFIAGATSHIATVRNMKNKRELYALYQTSLHYAKCAAYPGPKRRAAGGPTIVRQRLADATMGDDVD